MKGARLGGRKYNLISLLLHSAPTLHRRGTRPGHGLSPYPYDCGRRASTAVSAQNLTIRVVLLPAPPISNAVSLDGPLIIWRHDS